MERESEDDIIQKLEKKKGWRNWTPEETYCCSESSENP